MSRRRFGVESWTLTAGYMAPSLFPSSLWRRWVNYYGNIWHLVIDWLGGPPPWPGTCYWGPVRGGDCQPQVLSVGSLHTLLPSESFYFIVTRFFWTLHIKGLCFLLPYTIWKRWEQGKLSRIIPIEDLKHQHKSKVLSPDEVKTWYSFILLHSFIIFNFFPRFTTSYRLVDQKKINLAVAKMKDYFLTRNGIQAPSRYMMKVFYLLLSVLSTLILYSFF